MTLIGAIFGGILIGVFLSLVLFSPEKQRQITSWFSQFTQPKQTESLITPTIIYPTYHVDAWVGQSFPTIVATEMPSVTISPTITGTIISTTTATPTHVGTIISTPTPTTSPTNTPTSTPTTSATVTPTAVPTVASNDNTKKFSRKVLLIHVDPQVQCPYKSNATMSLHECMNWNNPHTMAPGVASFFKNTTSSHVEFTIVQEYTQNTFTEWTNGCFQDSYWNECSSAGNCSRPTKCTSNFTYTQAEFFRCIDDPDKNSCLYGETNMKKMMTNYGLPGKVNNGTIDEVWLYGAPWMSMWESQAIGPRAFGINSPEIVDNTYSRTTVMMPMSYERDLGTSIHNFSHRFEATMSRVYGGWAENSTSHNWNRFGLDKAQSPNYSYSGCGSGHYPPNAVSDYDYGNTTNVVNTTCDTFYSYPNLSLYGTSVRPVTCSEWGCTEYGYFGWWMAHFPHYKGVGPDGKANDWWYYLLDLDNVFKPGAQVTSNQ